MKTYLYLDDERVPKTDHNWVIVRSYKEAVNYIETEGVPDYISFDHDLGTDENGYDFAKFLGDFIVQNELPMFKWNVHSANPVGAKNINMYFENLVRFLNQ